MSKTSPKRKEDRAQRGGHLISLNAKGESLVGTANESETRELVLMRLRKEMWEKAVETQMHFNEMSYKSRQLCVTFVIGSLGTPGILTVSNIQLNYVSLLQLSGAIALVAATSILLLGNLDAKLYQKLLLGAVKFGWELERTSLVKDISKTPFGMTTYISIAAEDLNEDGTVRDPSSGQWGLRKSIRQIENFYRYCAYPILFVGVSLIALDDLPAFLGYFSDKVVLFRAIVALVIASCVAIATKRPFKRTMAPRGI